MHFTYRLCLVSVTEEMVTLCYLAGILHVQVVNDIRLIENIDYTVQAKEYKNMSLEHNVYFTL